MCAAGTGLRRPMRHGCVPVRRFIRVSPGNPRRRARETHRRVLRAGESELMVLVHAPAEHDRLHGRVQNEGGLVHVGFVEMPISAVWPAGDERSRRAPKPRRREHRRFHPS